MIVQLLLAFHILQFVLITLPADPLGEGGVFRMVEGDYRMSMSLSKLSQFLKTVVPALIRSSRLFQPCCSLLGLMMA
jgi:hypothetical protein